MQSSKSSRIPNSLHNRTEGFTLAEVALAMAIFSFALVSMLGLLSVGLKSSRKANLQTAASNLLATIASDIQAATVEDSPDLLKHTYKSPLLGITATYKEVDYSLEVQPSSIILTEGGTDATNFSVTDQGTLKKFQVSFLPPITGLSSIRVRISWPANLPPTATPEGSIESLVPLPVR